MRNPFKKYSHFKSRLDEPLPKLSAVETRRLWKTITFNPPLRVESNKQYWITEMGIFPYEN